MRAQQLKNLSLSSDDILAALGLERRRTWTRSWAPALGMFGAGIVVGTGLALLFAPKPGNALRGDIGRSAGNLARRVRVRGLRNNGQIDIAQLSEDELLERAAALGIDDRSQMSRDELISAISNH